MNEDILRIIQEECAEVIQAISKVLRFGMHDVYNGQTNLERLEEELGDLLCMIDLLMKNNIVFDGNVYAARAAKMDKLRIWSNI